MESGSNSGPSQNSGSSGDSSKATGIMSVDACGPYGWLSGLGSSNFSTSMGGGSEFNASRSAPSEFAEDVAKFAEESLEEVMDGDVSTDCFIESKVPGGGSVYVAFTLPSRPDGSVAQAVGDVMKDKGSSVIGSYSSSVADGAFDLVSMQNIPVAPPVGDIAMGALYFVTTPDEDYQVVMLVSYTDDMRQIPPGGASPTLAAAPTKVTEVVPTGTAGEINKEIQAALEKALGEDLLVHSFFQNNAGGQNSVSVIYQVRTALETGPTSTAFSSVVEDLGGSVTAAIAGGEAATVLFENMKVSGYTATGNVSYANNQVIFSTTSVTK